jgi:glycosyltransferase involved in cell wall biosynthesis
MDTAKQMRLVLFLTRGSSLKDWEKAGLLSRELAIYKKLQNEGVAITLVTYGKRSDLNFSSQIPDMKIICNRWSLPESWYIRFLPILIWLAVGKEWIGKSNQILGADIGLSVARKASQKFIVRGGYVFSLNSERAHGIDSQEADYARTLEATVFAKADKVVVTTESSAKEIRKRYSLPTSKIVVIPNYVDTDVFRRVPVEKGENIRIGYIGRLVEAKNPLALLNAISGLPISLYMVGGGPLLATLRQKAQEQGSEVIFAGYIPNSQLPQILNQCDLFVLPSLYEGHPKSLLEAMACALPVIATDVPGNRELIRHEVDGILCGTSADEIRKAILRLKENKTLRTQLGENARRHVVEEFSLDRVAKMEMELLREMSVS